MQKFKDLAKEELLRKATLRLVDQGFEPKENDEFIWELRNSQSISEIRKAIKNDKWRGVSFSKFFINTDCQDFWNDIQGPVFDRLDRLLNEYDVTEFRNGMAHLKTEKELSITSEQALEIRNIIIGVGCTGIINWVLELYPVISQQRILKKAI